MKKNTEEVVESIDCSLGVQIIKKNKSVAINRGCPAANKLHDLLMSDDESYTSIDHEKILQLCW